MKKPSPCSARSTSELVSGVFLLSDYTTGVTMAEQTMSLERAMENAIVSTEMEGFVVTREQRELM